MKCFLVGICLIIAGGVLAIILMPIVTNKDWIFLPLGIILIGGLFQVAAFLKSHSAMNDLDRKFRNLTSL